MKKSVAFLLLLQFLPLFFIFAQEEDPSDISDEISTEIPDDTLVNIFTDTPKDASQDAPVYEENAVFIINSFYFDITGITKQFALINKGNFNKGELITGYASLENYVNEKRQILYNERALQSVEIQYFIGEKDSAGRYLVHLKIITKDSWNIIPLPKPQYSTNSGFKLTINYRDYNFLGTLAPLRIDLGYKYDNNWRHYYSIMWDSSIPFSFIGFQWNFIFVNNFDYRPQFDYPFYYNNTTGLSINLPLGKTTIGAGFRESIYINQENDDGDKPHYGDTQKGIYLTSNPSIHWVIPTGMEVKNYGQVYYVPYFNATIPHSFDKWPLKSNPCDDPNHVHDLKAYITLNFGHSVSFGRIDWIGDFKKGFSFNAGNSYSYSFRNKNYDARPIDMNYQISATAYHILKENMASLSGRFIVRHWLFSSVNGSAGDVLRGIPDDNVKADFIGALNVDFTIKVWEVRPSEWFGINKFRIFNFDLHIVPFFDAALFHHPDHQMYMNVKSLLFSGGLEAVLYPRIARSLNLRLSFGLNLSKFDLSPNSIKSGYDHGAAGKYEVYVGTEFHF